MKNKILFYVLCVLCALCFICLTLFFTFRAISAHDKEWEYFNVYRARAVDYIKKDSDILNRYGDDVSVEFDNSITYSEVAPKPYFKRLAEVFNPNVPETFEEFDKNIKSVKLYVEVNGESYEITFERDMQGGLNVSLFTKTG